MPVELDYAALNKAFKSRPVLLLRRKALNHIVPRRFLITLHVFVHKNFAIPPLGGCTHQHYQAVTERGRGEKEIIGGHDKMKCL